MNNQKIHKLLTDNGFALADNLKLRGNKYHDTCWENFVRGDKTQALVDHATYNTKRHDVSVTIYENPNTQKEKAEIVWCASGSLFDEGRTPGETRFVIGKMQLAVKLCKQINGDNKNDPKPS